MTLRGGDKSKNGSAFLRPQKFREVRYTPGYLESLRQIKETIEDRRILNLICKSLEEQLWKNAHTMPPFTPGSSVHIYKPDVMPPLSGEISVFFTFDTHMGAEAIFLHEMTYERARPEED